MRALPRASTSAACYQDTPWSSPCAARLGVRSGLKPEALANAKSPQTTRLFCRCSRTQQRGCLKKGGSRGPEKRGADVE